MVMISRMRTIGGLAVLMLLAMLRPAAAQWEEPELTPEQRDKKYAELAIEAEQMQRMTTVLRDVVHLVKPAVVHIDSEHSDTPGRYGRREVQEAGSGTIVQYNDKFYVLTNRHVIKGAARENIKIKLADGRELNPSNIWADPQTDVAVLGIEAPPEGPALVPARIGKANDVDIGDFVIAVGSPFGLSHSVTFGIISAKDRHDLPFEVGDGVRLQNFLQTDAAINPGNSGGPLLNLKGEVVGMNTAIASSSGGNEGIGFTIPIDLVSFVARQMIEHNGLVTRAYLGVEFYDKDKDKEKFTAAEAARMGLPRPCGARIKQATHGSPADLARLQPDDVIIRFNNVDIEDDSHLAYLVSLVDVGKEVPIVVFRNKQKLPMKVIVSDRSKFDAKQ
jgi:serine protease Do